MKKIEETAVFTAPDRRKIYATIGYPAKKSSSIIVFAHGLGSTEYWPPMLLGSWFFRKQGFSYCRVNSYDWRPGARTLMTSDLKQHSRDIDTVVRSLRRRGYSTIFGVGHSFGGLTLLQSETDAFTALSLWEVSSFRSYPPQQWYRRDKESGATYLLGAAEYLLSPRYRRGIENFPDEIELISKLTIPTQICYAERADAWLAESSHRYFNALETEKQLVAIPGASHSFTEEGVSKTLFRKTLRWFERYA